MAGHLSQRRCAIGAELPKEVALNCAIIFTLYRPIRLPPPSPTCFQLYFPVQSNTVVNILAAEVRSPLMFYSRVGIFFFRGMLSRVTLKQLALLLSRP